MYSNKPPIPANYVRPTAVARDSEQVDPSPAVIDPDIIPEDEKDEEDEDDEVPQNEPNAPNQNQQTTRDKEEERRRDAVGRQISEEAEKQALSRSEFSLRLGIAGRHHLVNKTRDGKEYYITLSTLQRMVLHDLQEQLTRLVARIHGTKNASRRRMNLARDLMAAYTTALRDYDYMVDKVNEATELGTIDPFKVTSQRRMGECLLDDARLLPGGWARRSRDGSIYHRKSRTWTNVLPRGSRMEITTSLERVRFLERLWMGLAGGLGVVVPMVIMVLREDLLTRLLTTGLFVLAFAIVLAWVGTKMRGETVIGLVAAYAAVLVVFVGVN